MVPRADGGEGEREGGDAHGDGFAQFEEGFGGGGGGEGAEGDVWVEGRVGGGFGVGVGWWRGVSGHETLEEGGLFLGRNEPDRETWISRKVI